MVLDQISPQGITKIILYPIWNEKQKNEVDNPELTLNNSDCYFYSSLWENMIEKHRSKLENGHT